MSPPVFTRLLCLLCLLAVTGLTWAERPGAGVVRVVAAEGANVILPCSLTNKENLELQVFDWKRGETEVFFYSAGIHYNNGHEGQDAEFKGRVFHFEDQLTHGNASIMIRNTQLSDSGTYTCLFPRLSPEQRFSMELVVEQVFKDRSGEISTATRRPYVIYDLTDVGVELRCEVQDAVPQPELQWQDSEGNILLPEGANVTETEGRHNVVLYATVTRTTTNRFFCEAKQESIGHVVRAEITVPERLFELFEDKSCPVAGVFVGGWFSGVVTVVVPLALYIIIKTIKKHRRKRSSHQNGFSQVPSEPVGSEASAGSSRPEKSSAHQNGSVHQANGSTQFPLESVSSVVD